MYLIQTVVIKGKIMFQKNSFIIICIWYTFKQTAIGIHTGNKFLLFCIISIVAFIIEQNLGVVDIDGTMIQIPLGSILQHSFVCSVRGHGAIRVKMGSKTGQKRVQQG